MQRLLRPGSFPTCAPHNSDSQPILRPITRHTIVGTGAVGAFYGSRLALAPNTLVSVTCRSNYAQVAKSGLALDTHSFGSYHFTPHQAFPSIAAASKAADRYPFDYVVVSTKALPDVLDDSEMIAPVVDIGTSIVLIQNGVGVEEPHRNRFKDNVVLSAVTVVSAAQTSPGVIRQNRWTRISVGPYLSGGGAEQERGKEGEKLASKSDAACGEFVQMLQKGGIADAEQYDEKGLQLVRWHKLAVRTIPTPLHHYSNAL